MYRQCISPKTTNESRHSRFTRWTQDSAKGLRFGLKGGMGRNSMPSDSRIEQSFAVNLQPFHHDAADQEPRFQVEGQQFRPGQQARERRGLVVGWRRPPL